MSHSIQPLPWDSDLMGFAVARLTLAQADAAETARAIAECRAAGYHLVYGVVNTDDDAANCVMRAAGAWLADRKVTYARPLPPAAAAPAPDPAIVLATGFTPALEALAWQSGAYSRFRLDPRLPANAFQRMYSQWLRGSLDGSLAQAVLVLHSAADRALGLMTLGEKQGIAKIGLVAVDANAGGQQVGQRLMAETVRRAAAAGFAELQVVTQGENPSACRFYEKCGFVLVHEVHIYHLWLR